jgi:hypothetical protein
LQLNSALILQRSRHLAMLKRLRKMKQRLHLQQRLQRQLSQLRQHLQRQQLRALATIHFQQVAQFHVHRALVIIHFQQVVQFRVHHNDHRAKTVLDWAHHVQVWQVHVLVLFAQVLQRVQEDNVLQQLELEQEITHHVLVERQHRKVLIVHKEQQLVERQVVQHVLVEAVLIAAQVAAELQVHLERMQVNLQSVSRSHVRCCAKNSTICKHLSWVAQLFRTEMVQPKSVCVAAHRLQISPKELAQIQQR